MLSLFHLILPMCLFGEAIHHGLRTVKTGTPAPLLLPGNKYRISARNDSVFTDFIRQTGREEIGIQDKEKSDVFMESQEISYIEPDTVTKNQPRLFFSPTGFLLKKGEREYRNTMILSNNLKFGLSDHINVGFGLAPFGEINGLTMDVKIGRNIGRWIHVAVGAHGLLGFSFSGLDGSQIGLYYGMVSFGKRNRFFNIGIGRGEQSDTKGPVTSVTLGASYQLDTRWRLFLEHMRLYDGDENIFEKNTNLAFQNSAGASWTTGRHQLDFGLLIYDYEDPFSNLFPIVGYSLRF